jgi:predicted aconitase
MELTKQEQAMLDGKEGYATRKSMEILVALGEIFGAVSKWQEYPTIISATLA